MDNNKEYKVEVIYNSKIYAKKSNNGHIPSLYNLILWKNYLKEDNI